MLSDAPWTVNDRFIIDKRIDYLALEEGSSVNPEFDKERLKGYDEVKKLGTIQPPLMICKYSEQGSQGESCPPEELSD